MLTKRNIEDLNAPKGGESPRRPVALAALASLVLFAAGYLLLDSLVVGGALAGVVVLLAALVVARGRKQPVLQLRYGMMDRPTAARFARMGKAFEVLVASEKLWRPATQEDGGAGEEPVRIEVAQPPGIDADVEVWSLGAGGVTAYFLPEAMLLHEEGRYRAVAYTALEVDMSAERVAEEGPVPADAEVMGTTWRYLSEDGSGPDRSKAQNRRLPQVVYGVLRLESEGWEGTEIWVSNEAAAAQFALAFLAANPNPDRVDRWAGAQKKADPAYGILGLRDGAPRNEVTAAYRRMARAYHPDRTANFVPEFRALANRRMQEINAAYSRLRREAT